MLSKTLRITRFFTQAQKIMNATELTAKMQQIRNNIKITEQQTQVIKKQIKQRQTKIAEENKIIHEKRTQLTEDVKKAEKVWQNAKKQSEINKLNAIKSFANSLIGLGNHFNEVSKHQTEQHPVDLREGFQNTARLFFNTLQKFKITKLQLDEGSAFKKDQVQIIGQQKTDVEGKKGKIHKLVQIGWQLQGKTIRKPKVIIYS